ncbi:MAG: ABC transporter permease [Mesorhizobium sp.]|nr:MAG: ABC transporter permease [Mesorhizobium sp.]
MSQVQEFEKALANSETSVAAFDEHGTSLVKRIQHFLHSTPAAVPLIVLVLSIAVFGATIGGRFFSSYTLTLILQQIAIVGILGAAQTLVILTAGIDLSIGVIMVISAVIMGNCAVTYGLPTLLAVVIGLAAGAACGLLNGVLVAYMKLPPFIVTLGTWNIVMATNFIYSANETIRDADVDVQAPLLHLFGLNFKVGTAVLTFGVIAMVVLVLFLWYGGISLFGGRGSILGTLFGAMIVGVVSMGLNMLGADPQWKVLLTGVLIIGAVAIDQWIRKVSV